MSSCSTAPMVPAGASEGRDGAPVDFGRDAPARPPRPAGGRRPGRPVRRRHRARRYVNLDAAASTSAFPSVMAAVDQFVPMYSSVHRGAGYKSRLGHRRLRVGPGHRPRLRRAPDRRRRHRHPVPQHHRGPQPPRLPPAPRARRRGAHHRGRASRQPVALGPGGAAALRRVRGRRHLRHRRRHRRPRPTARGPGCSPSPAPPT